MNYNEQQATTPESPAPSGATSTSLSSSFPAYLCLDPSYTRSYDGPNTSLSNQCNLSSQFVVPKQYFYLNAIKMFEKHYGYNSPFAKRVLELCGENRTFVEDIQEQFFKSLAKEIYEDTKHKVAGMYVDNFYKFLTLKLTSNSKVIPPSVRQFISNNVSDEIVRSKNIEKVWASLQADTFTNINDALLKYNIINATNADSFTPSTDIFNSAMEVTTELDANGKPVFKYPMNPNASPMRSMFDYFDMVQKKVYTSFYEPQQIIDNNNNQYIFDTSFMNAINCFTPITPDIPLPMKSNIKDKTNDLTMTPDHKKFNELDLTELQKDPTTGNNLIYSTAVTNTVAQTTGFLKKK